MNQRSDRSLDPGEVFAGVFSSQPPPYRPRWWLHVVLFLLTLASTTVVGGSFFGRFPPELLNEQQGLGIFIDPRFILGGLQFSLPLLFILLCHELGHYIACRRHGLKATPPFFLPLPLGIGTLGAVIRIKEPIRDKQQLLDIGAAGPIAGFIALLPFLFTGLAYAEFSDLAAEGDYFLFGEPLIYRLVQMVVLPGVADTETLVLHPSGWAAWCGILITLLNMLPFAQLDGGHVTYALFGRLQRRAAWPMLALLVALGFLWWGWWLWAVIVILLRVHHPRIWDEDRALDPRRRAVAWFAILIFVLCFMLEPIRYVP